MIDRDMSLQGVVARWHSTSVRQLGSVQSAAAPMLLGELAYTFITTHLLVPCCVQLANNTQSQKRLVESAFTVKHCSGCEASLVLTSPVLVFAGSAPLT